MTDSSSSLVLNAMLEEFGDNAPFALDLYARYRLDPSLVEDGWRQAFRALEERVPFAMSVPARLVAPAPAPLPAPAPPAAAAPASARTAPPAARAGEQAVVIAGGAATIARNMEASLGVPTATTNRVIAVKNMEENRRILNRHREALGLSKISFTHFVAWAIVRALEKHPGMNDAFGEVDGRPARIKKPSVNLGIAIDITKKDGTRSLLVPNIKGAEKMAFGGFLDAFDALVAKARGGTIEPDAFAGTTISLTNPGTIGTTSSLPRLMPGQGAIIATGAMGYPAEFQAMPEEAVSSSRNLPRDERLLDVRPSDHPGRRVGAVHRHAPGPSSRRRTVLRPDLRGPQGPAPADALGEGRELAVLRRRRTVSRPSRNRRASSRSSTRTACAATSSRT